ncbi:MAG: PEGA domain-containing protein, partial [Myxococcales bacterium]|nr:PEGA domain-containing protein [Myxococcales bacterium]
LDFGIAKLLKPIGDIPQSGTAAGIVIGTPEYMAPEQALGSATDRRADLYAVGLVLYELVAGVQPFRADTFGKLVVEITSKPPPTLPDVNALGEPVHPVLKAIINRCLEKEPDRRFQSAEALAEALEPFATGGPIRPLAPTPVPAAPTLTDEEVQVVRPSKTPLVVAAVVALGLVAAGIVFATTENPPPVVTPPPAALATALPAVPASARVSLDLTSTPPGAKVTRADSNVELGVTPVRIEVDRGQTVSLIFSLEGHEPLSRPVSLAANASVSVDLTPTPKQDVPVAPVKVRGPGGKKPVSRDGVVDPFSQ